jgi:hypothetical protein
VGTKKKKYKAIQVKTCVAFFVDGC